MIPLRLALATAVLLAQAQARREYPGRQGSIVSDAPPAVAKLWVERLDRFCGVFEKFYSGLGLEKRSDNKVKVRVFASFDEYSEFKARDNKDLNAMAYFSPSLNSVVMYHDANDPWLAHTLFHETQHQYLARYTSAAPKWTNEGLSEYFEGWSLGDDGKLESRPNLYDLLLLQSELEKKRGFPLAKLVRLSPSGFNDFAKDHPDLRSYLHYATSWGLVYYFLEVAEPSDREIFRGYLRDLNAKGAKAERAELAILDWNAFEAKWREAILRLDASCKTRDEYLQVAAGHRGNGDFPDAIGAYKKALELDPKTLGVHFWLGWCLAVTGAIEEARKELEVARAEDKEDARPSYQLARLAAAIDRPGSQPDAKAALAYAKEAFERSGKTNASYLAFVAVCEKIGGDKRAAYATMNQVLKLASEEAKPRFEKMRDDLSK